MKSFSLITLLLALSLFISACGNNNQATEAPANTEVPATEVPATEPPAATETPLPQPTPEPTATTATAPDPTATTAPASQNNAEFETYNHPTGAFSLDVPSAWEINTESDDQVIIYDASTPSILMAFIFDVGTPLAPDALADFSKSSVDTMMAGLSPQVNILQEGLLEGSDNQYSSFMDFSSRDGGGQAQFIYTQEEGVVFMLAFVSSDYFNSIDTWQKIRDSHQTDAEALRTE